VDTTDSFPQRCIRFSVRILNLVDAIPRVPRTRSIIDQIVRSATSIGANTSEAKSAQSRADFIHKFEIALKEARETTYWLELLKEARLVDNGRQLGELANECGELTAILIASIRTAKTHSKS
jgi:four helix bundle protein